MSFHRAFRQSLRTAEAHFGEGCSWLFEGIARTAISVGSLTAQQRATYGGRFHDAHLTLSVRVEAWNESLASAGSLLTISAPDLPAETVRVAEVERPGNGCVVLICGPEGIETPRR